MRSKLYHIPFWLLYVYLWWVIQLGNPLKAALYIVSYSPYTVNFIFFVVFQALAVYFNLYFLMPRLLEKNRLVLYITGLSLTIAAAAACIVPGYYIGSGLSGKTFVEIYGPGSYCIVHFFGTTLLATFAGMMLAISIKLTKNWIQSKRRQQMQERNNLQTELNFLKNQFNPHFLFNTINSIFFLIHKNPDMASSSLAKFSQLLRYQLYECNDTQIQFSKEIIHMENAVELEKIRSSDYVKVAYQVEADFADHWVIAPFILMTFIENAFKHVSKNEDKSNWIKIRLSVDGGQLDFQVSNSTSRTTLREATPSGGIGLKNVQRRLDLLYPEKYVLDIREYTHSFEVHLQLLLTPMAVQPLMQKTG